MAIAPSSADRVLRLGALLTALGLLFLLIALVPLVAPSVEMPGVMWFLAMLTGVGLAVMFVGLTMQSRQRRR